MSFLCDCGWMYPILFGVFVVYFYLKYADGHFKRKGIKHLPFDYPLFGNVFNVMILKEHFKESVARVYKAFPNEKYIGYKQLNSNVVMLKDLDLIKQIAIKDFDHFLDHKAAIDENLDNIFGKNLFALKGEKWRDLRATLSPAFTSSKMKNMFQFIVETSEEMVEYYANQMKESQWRERGLVEIEMKDTFTRYTNDVIATSAFGFKVNSFADKTNKFYEAGKEASSFQGLRLVKFVIFSSFPTLARILNVQLFPAALKKYFSDIILQTVKERTEKGIVRQDMIHLLIEARKGTLKHESVKSAIDTGFATVQEARIHEKATKKELSDVDLVAQAVIFFVAGFETSSTLLCFMCHELVLNPDVQKKLQEEIDAVQLNEKGHLEYDSLMKMNYMDMVVSETLRKWPPLVWTDRQCVKKYVLPPSSAGSKETILNVGESVMIPINAIQNDPKHYPNPDVFDPERFSEENKSKISASSFLPFGIGPRNCIGSRFALMESKAIMFYLLKRFDLVATAKTDNPLKISPKAFNMIAVNGFWIGLKPRS